MPPRSSSPICERSLDLTLIGIGRRDIPQCSSKHFHMEAFYRTFSGGQRPSADLAAFEGDANVASNAEVSASTNCQVDVTSRTLEAKLLLIETEEENCGYA